jgi:heme A synthase
LDIIGPVTGLARYCRFLLGYNLAVILWGAYVRASGSGAGCGSHWPDCNGEVVPLRRSVATWIEYSHRLSSGLVLVLVAGLALWAFRASPKGHPLRRGAVLSLLFTLSEAAVGAGLVLFKLVAHDESLARALAITTHLLNTLLLLAALTLAAYAAGAFGVPAEGASAAAGATPVLPAAPGSTERYGKARGGAGGERGRRGRPASLGWAFALGLAATMAIGATGAIAALGDTLFPAASLRQGFAQDLSAASHLLLRLRGVHPLLAIALGAYLLYLCQLVQQSAPAGTAPRRWAQRLRLLVMGQWAVGVANLGLLAPVWLQLTHLLVADLVWIALVLLALSTLALQPSPARLPPLAPPVAAPAARG